jgi:outer membrane murein-binding lipoprotein Lpp
VKEKHLDGNPELTVESVTRASTTCGHLYNWVDSQIKCSTIYSNVEALSAEVAQLEEDAKLVTDENTRSAIAANNWRSLTFAIS